MNQRKGNMNNKASKKRAFWSIKMAIAFIVILAFIVAGVKIFLALKSGVEISTVLTPADFSVRSVLLAVAAFIATTVAIYIFFYPDKKEEQ